MIKCNDCRGLYHFLQFNNTGAVMLDLIYDTTLKLLRKLMVGVTTSRFSNHVHGIIMAGITSGS